MKRLSVCMIVKDEEAVLERCLESVRGIADEIIIVDTGSTDATKAIAKRYTDKIYDYVWTNDFAAARNESLKHATGKWILVLDADEYLSLDELDEWNSFLNRETPLPYLAYTLPVINFTGDKRNKDEITSAPVTRLFPNHMGIIFERPIHEQLTRISKNEHMQESDDPDVSNILLKDLSKSRSHENLYHKKLSLNIFHTGYQIQTIVNKNKHERNMKIFEAMRENQELDYYDWFTLGNQYRYAREEEKALECYEKALEIQNTSVVWYPHCLIGLITLYYKMNRLPESWKLTEEKLSRYSDFSEYHTICGFHYETLGFTKEAVASYRQAIEIGELRARQGKEIWLTEPVHSFDSPVQQLVSLGFRINDNQQAIYWMSKQLNKNKQNPRVLLQLVQWLSQNETETNVIEFLDRIYDKTNPTDAALIFKVALALGQPALAKHYEPYAQSHALHETDQLRRAILNKDAVQGHRLLKLAMRPELAKQRQLWLQVVVGALIWNKIDLLEESLKYLDDAKTLKGATAQILKAMKGQEPDHDARGQFAECLFLVSKQLFLIQEFSLFDQVVGVFQSPALINQLANHFYSLNLVPQALQYYSLLLDKQQLDHTSLENLAMYHVNHGFNEEAVDFLKEAIAVQPGKRHLYSVLMGLLSNEDFSALVQQFEQKFPGFSSITFVEEFIREKALV